MPDPEQTGELNPGLQTTQIERSKQFTTETPKDLDNSIRKLVAEGKTESYVAKTESMGIAVTRLEKAIMAHPDANPNVLQEVVRILEDNLDLEDHQVKGLFFGLNVYQQRHKVVKRIHQEHPKAPDLYQTLFGRTPQGKVQVKEGPISLHFVCASDDDYAYLFSQVYRDSPEISDTQRNSALDTGGAFLQSSFLVPGLEKCITIERKVVGREFKPHKHKTKVHEDQHAINDLFESALSKTKKVSPNQFSTDPDSDVLIAKWQLIHSSIQLREIFGKMGENERELMLRRLFRVTRAYQEPKTKDELLAYFKDQRFSAKQISGVLTMSKENGGIYDYYHKDFRDGVVLQMARTLEESGLGSNNQELVARSTEHVFVFEHQRMIDQGISAMQVVESLGYDRKFVVNYFNSLPLRDWFKAAKRMMAVKEPGMNIEQKKKIIQAEEQLEAVRKYHKEVWFRELGANVAKTVMAVSLLTSAINMIVNKENVEANLQNQVTNISQFFAHPQLPFELSQMPGSTNDQSER